MAEILIYPNFEAAAAVAARYITQRVRDNSRFVLGVATGSTPLPVYRQLETLARSEHVDFSAVRAVALDEYVDLPPSHPQSYRSFIEQKVARPLGLTPQLVHVPDGSTSAIETAGNRYEETIRSVGGVDVQILGIGRDGHLGFNEPGSSLASDTRVKTLRAETRRDNARFFPSPEDVPLHVITQGLGTIRRARHLLLLATGRSKAAAVAAAVEGPVTAKVPASVVQLHPHVTVLLDDDGASELKDRNYYREAQANKPAWQGL